MVGKGLEGFLASTDKLPIAPSAGASRQSVLKRLLASSPIVTVAIARLWSRATKDAMECTVSRALGLAQGKGGIAIQRPKDLPGSEPCPKMRELSLLLAMGLVYQGSGPFLGGKGYLLFPHDSKRLPFMDRRKSFGVLAYPDSMHIFVDLHHLRWVSRPINEQIYRYLQAHGEAQLFLHLVYRGVPPNLAGGVGKDWPLIAIPSVIAEWHERPRPSQEPGKDPDVQFDRVRFFNPNPGSVKHMLQFARAKSWPQWKVAWDQVETKIDQLKGSNFKVVRFPCLDRSWPRWAIRQLAEGGSGEGQVAPPGMEVDPLNEPPDQVEADQTRGKESGPATTLRAHNHLRQGWKVQGIRTINTRYAPSTGPKGKKGRALLREVQAWKRRILTNPMNINVPDYSNLDVEDLDRAERLLGGGDGWSMPGEPDPQSSTWQDSQPNP